MRIYAALSLAGLAALVAPSMADAAVLIATPGIPAGSAQVTLNGRGFAGGAPGVVRLSGQRAIRFRTDDRGRASVVLGVRRSTAAGAHRLVMQAGGKRVSTRLTVVASKRAPSRLVALSSGQRALLSPAHARAGESFTLKVTGLRRAARVRVSLRATTVAEGRANARGAMTIAAQIPVLAPGRHLVHLESGRTRMSLRLVVLAPTTPTPAQVVTPFGVGNALDRAPSGVLGPPASPAGLPPATPAPPAPPLPPLPPPPAGTARIAAAGDIACAPGSSVSSESCRQKATSDLLVSGSYDAVLPLGDNQYYCGSLQAFNRSYGPSWGRVLARTRPVIGNHEYLDHGDSDCTRADGGGYFDYFGAAAGARGKGYYSYDVGSWHLIALNSNCAEVGGCDASNPQGRWLASDLKAHRNRCTLAYWHIPLFSSGGRASNNTAGFWSQLYAAGADVILTSHDHIYERFAPQRPNGAADSQKGIRQFVVGTGGANHTSIATIERNSEVRDTSTYGVLELTLASASYDWRFRPESGGRFTDTGRTACH